MKSKQKILIISASLYLTDHEPAGEGLIAYEIIKRLCKKYDMTIICPRKNIKEKLNCKIIEVGKYNFFPAPPEFTYKLNYWKYTIRTYLIIKKLLKQENFDIFHYMMPVNINQSFTLLNKKPFVSGPLFYPWIEITEKEYGENTKKNKKTTLFDKIKYRIIRLNNKYTLHLFNKMLNNSDKIILTIPKIKNILKNTITEKFEIIPVGCNTEYFIKDIKDNQNKQDNTIVILFTAYLVKRKGLHYLLEAISILKNKTSNKILLKVIGDGPDRIFFENKVRELKIENNVEFIGIIAHNETLKYYQKANIYCHPALGEPFGLSIAEAMSCSLPVVAFNLGGAPEVLTKINEKLLAKARDSEDLSKKLLFLIENPEKRKEIGEQNRQIAVNNYDWNVIADKYCDIYDKLISQ